MKSTARRVTALAGGLAVVAAACGGGGGSSTKPLDKVGAGEGALSLIIWPGYAESGKNDPKVDWVTPFETASGCKVTTKEAQDSAEMVTLMRQGSTYDGVSASGDATNRLIAGGNVAELNVSLIPDFANITPKLQSPPHNTVNGKHYGISYQWGANVLMYNTDKVTPAPTSWAAVFDQVPAAAKGKLTPYTGAIYIADAALYLKSAKPELGITDPYELTQAQFDAAIVLLKAQKGNAKLYWGTTTEQTDAFKSGDAVMGPSWPYQVNLLEGDKQPVASVIPKEGATGWADSWMMSSKAAHPNCMYKWMQWTATPDVQAQVASYFGSAPANPKACDVLGKETCDAYHVTDDAYFSQISFWKTPLADCGNGKTTCIDFADWTKAWTEVKG